MIKVVVVLPSNEGQACNRLKRVLKRVYKSYLYTIFRRARGMMLMIKENPKVIKNPGEMTAR